MRRDPRSYSPKERAGLIGAIEEAAENGKNVILAARELGITASIYYRWIRERAKSARPTNPPDPKCPAPMRGYPEQRKLELVAEIQQLVTQGLTIEAASRTVGISGTTYHQWVRAGMTPAPRPEPTAPPMRPVEVITALVPAKPRALAIVEPPEPRTLTLFAPGGYRIEGLTTESAAALLKALA